MCIPCVMCGACMGLSEDGAPIAPRPPAPRCGEVVGGDRRHLSALLHVPARERQS